MLKGEIDLYTVALAYTVSWESNLGKNEVRGGMTDEPLIIWGHESQEISFFIFTLSETVILV